MTATLVVRLSKKELAAVDLAARKKTQSRSAFVRQLLRQHTHEAESSKGVNWREHFEWQRKHGRKVDWKLVHEMREQERNRSTL